MPWHAHLQIDYRHDTRGTSAHDRHEGPLRVLQRLYPEGPGICHHVIVHPPGGIVGGDTLQIDLRLDADSHALITTPGASRFYRSSGASAGQCVQARLDRGGRLEWLPLETLAYSGCRMQNRQSFELAQGAEMIGWDLLALGLPAAGQAFESGSCLQQIELPGRWLERGRIDAADTRLLESPLGLAGRRVLGTMWFAAGTPLADGRRDALLDAARECSARHDALAAFTGSTAVNDAVIVLRVLAARVEPAMRLLADVWSAWRQQAWRLAAVAPRVWRT